MPMTEFYSIAIGIFETNMRNNAHKTRRREYCLSRNYIVDWKWDNPMRSSDFVSFIWPEVICELCHLFFYDPFSLCLLVDCVSHQFLPVEITKNVCLFATV